MNISVVIPCYNSEKYISKTIDSLLCQTITPDEIIAIYDKGEDNTLDILRKEELKNKNIIKIIELKENRGISFARNYGVKVAKNNLILFMDSDDVAENRLIEKYIDKLGKLNINKENNYILFYSAYVQIDKDDKVINQISRGIDFGVEEALGYEFIRNHIMSTSGVMLYKRDFISVGGFNKKIKYSEDWDLWLRLAAVGNFAYIDEPLVKIRRHSENSSRKILTMLEAEKNILKQYDVVYIKNAIFKRKLSDEQNIVDYVSLLFRLDKWGEGFLELKKLLDEGYNFYNVYFYLGLYYLKYENFEKALEYFNKTIDIKNNHGAALNNSGALYLLKGIKDIAKKQFDLAMSYFPTYMDVNGNYELLEKESIEKEDLKFTWRELREVLTSYSG